MRTEKELLRRKMSRKNFIKIAMAKGISKMDAAVYFDEQQVLERAEFELGLLIPPLSFEIKPNE